MPTLDSKENTQVAFIDKVKLYRELEPPSEWKIPLERNLENWNKAETANKLLNDLASFWYKNSRRYENKFSFIWLV